MYDEYSSWKDGKTYLLYECWSSDSQYLDKKFVTLEEAIDIIAKDRYNPKPKNEITEEFIEEHGADYGIFTYYSFQTWCSYLEFYEERYETSKGETIMAFGHYGYDG
jgi:hypothetical protein